ncbi:recombinase family protein [Shewanella xiamenensis]|uniref:recombinase family protein n=1 Tax=Shewanella xiamenensis TaxID=332186 RepID=UPI00313A935C
MALIGYARVSTQDQSLDAQINALTNAGCVKIYHGKQSGKSDDNWKKLDELIDYSREGDVVVVTAFDRLGRSLNQVLSKVDTLSKKGVHIKTLDGQIDTSNGSPMAKAFTQLLGVFAELEHSIITDRLQSGRVRTGKLGGRTPKLSPEQRKEVKMRLRNGESKLKLSKEFGVSRATILNIENEV